MAEMEILGPLDESPPPDRDISHELTADVARDALEALYAANCDIKSLEDALLVLTPADAIPGDVESVCRCPYIVAEGIVNLVRKIREKRSANDAGT